MFQSVTERLAEGKCVGIFPEGGSHDRPEFLPFKAGAAIMALTAMDKHPGLDVKIVPVGLNYFHGDRVCCLNPIARQCPYESADGLTV